jgi:hypothetical protein
VWVEPKINVFSEIELKEIPVIQEDDYRVLGLDPFSEGWRSGWILQSMLGEYL